MRNETGLRVGDRVTVQSIRSTLSGEGEMSDRVIHVTGEVVQLLRPDALDPNGEALLVIRPDPDQPFYPRLGLVSADQVIGAPV